MRLAYGAICVTGVAMAWATSAEAQGLQPPPTLVQQPYYPQQQMPQGQQQWGQSTTQQQLDNSIKQDSGRGFEIAYLNAEAGGGHLSLGGTGFSTTTSNGAMLGVGAGVRFITWTLGARFRLLPMADLTAWQLTGEAGFHLPVGAWDPYANVHLGYAKASLNNAPSDIPSPHGFDLGLSIGADYYLSAVFSLGVEATADALFLRRSADPSAPSNSSLASEMASTGYAVLGSLHAGLHFDL